MADYHSPELEHTLWAVPRTEAWVRCPRCSQRALVRQNRVTCGNCAYARVSDEVTVGGWCFEHQKWEGSTAEVPLGSFRRGQVKTLCAVCGKRESREVNVKRLASGIFIAPGACSCGGERSILAVSWTNPADIDADAATDRLFGLPYWLQTECAGHVLWAANLEHVVYLREFLSSTSRPQSGMGSRLPEWVISRKNRREVLRGLDRLEELAQG